MSRVAGPGDVDGDGVPDVLAGAPSNDHHGDAAGSARVHSGATGALVVVLYGDAAGDSFGSAVAGVGDVDQDGFRDFAVAASGDDDGGDQAGSVRVFSGQTGAALFTLHGSSAFASFGCSIDGAGDVDGDGVDDLVIGECHGNAGGGNSGRVAIHSGAGGALLRSFAGAPADQLGQSVAGAGDVDQDGHADVIAGAILADVNGPTSGAVNVFSGKDGSTLFLLPGAGPDDRLGWRVTGGFDFDGDGRLDVGSSSPYADAGGGEVGMARVWSGVDGSILQSVLGESSLADFGAALAFTGDLDGDGRSDMVVGEPRFQTATFDRGRVRVFVGLPASCPNLPGSLDFSHDGVPDACQVCQPDLTGEGPGNMKLKVCGDALTTAGSVARLAVSNGTPGVPVFLLAALTNQPTELLGGTVLPWPDPAVVAATLDGSGRFLIDVAGGAGVPVKVYVQAVAPWPGGPFEAELSGATAVTIGT